MFVLQTTSGLFYTGKAGDGWTSVERADAFAYSSSEEAERKASIFNRMSAVHGLTFNVKA